MVRVDVNPELLSWARERAGLTVAELRGRFSKLDEWEQGSTAPTLNQLEGFANATHTSVGLLLLSEPPHEVVPIPDYRTMADAGVRRPSPDLLDTIYLCQQRQAWYRSYAQLNQEPPVSFVGSLSTATPTTAAAETIGHALGFAVDERGRTFADAVRQLAESAERLGVLVMISGIVGSNTHRVLSPQEFRGFALVDDLAPVVFVNGVDTKGAQIFTLVHELAHVWLGASGLSDADPAGAPQLDVERWCNRVAAELLVPASALEAQVTPGVASPADLDRLARHFKVSTLVILRRLRDVRHISLDEYGARYDAELDRVLGFIGQQSGPGGGDFYNTQPVRVSKRFARAIITSTLEGHTLYSEAFQMLGFRKQATFDELAARLGVE